MDELRKMDPSNIILAAMKLLYICENVFTQLSNDFSIDQNGNRFDGI